MSTVAQSSRGSVTPDSLRVYLNEISRFRLLTGREEKEIALKIRSGDRMAFRTLVECNLRFVVSMAKRFRGSGYPIHELINEGNVGLVEAARRYDPDHEGRFTTYAAWWIREAILSAIAHFGQAWSVPPRVRYRQYQFTRRVHTLAQELGRSPDVDEIARRLDMSQREVRALMDLPGVRVPLTDVLTAEAAFALRAVVRDGAVERIERDLMASAFRRELEELFGQLDERERLVVERRYGLKGSEPKTLRDTGALMGLSAERVRQIEVRAIGKLRHSRRAQRMRGYFN